MNTFELGDLLIMYGTFLVFICIGVAFLLLGWFQRKKYNLSRRTGTSFEQMSAGTPLYDSEGENVDFLRPLEGDRKALSLSKVFLKMGIIFAGIGLLGIIMFTVIRPMHFGSSSAIQSGQI